jgi:hypothetical protein
MVTYRQWVIATMEEQYKLTFKFPTMDLMLDLISLYFSEYNIYSPLLHQPTFDKDIRNGLHLRDPGFGAVVLLVCALGARSSDDPRVLLDVEVINARMKGKLEHEKTYHSAGWLWFEQVQKSRLTLSFLPTTLYDMQAAYVSDTIQYHVFFSHQPTYFSWLPSIHGQHHNLRLRGIALDMGFGSLKAWVLIEKSHINPLPLSKKNF